MNREGTVLDNFTDKMASYHIDMYSILMKAEDYCKSHQNKRCYNVTTECPFRGGIDDTLCGLWFIREVLRLSRGGE